jgi:hypothetical protein
MLVPLQLPELCQGQLAVSVESHTGRVLDCTAVQTPGLLDDLFYTDEPLGAHYCPDTKQHRISVWVSTCVMLCSPVTRVCVVGC